MRIATFDIETSGLLPEVDTIWCAVVKDHDSGQITEFTPDNINRLGAHLDGYAMLVGHNCIAYDFPVLKKVLGYEYKGQVIDTLLMSRLQRPNRRAPSSLGGIAAHSVAAWGERLGHSKREHEDWTRFSPEMLERCKHDVAIQHRIYKALLKEGEGEGWEDAHRLNHRLFTLLQQQADYGFYVDRQGLDEAIATLDRWMVRIEKAITPHLPFVYEIQETKKDGQYGYLSKVLKKDGDYTKNFQKWFDTFPEGMPMPSIGLGGFSRISYRLVDLDRNNEVKNYLLRQGWEPEEWNYNNEGERTSPKLSKDDSFVGINSALGKLVVRRLRCRQRRGVLEGWRETIRPDGRLPSVVAGLASTGRARHKVIVNVPGSNAFFGKTMRSLFTAQPGWVLVGVDSVGNQIRQLAARMDDPEFTAVVLDPKIKVHQWNADRAGLSYEVAKTFFYGFIFGSGDTKTGKIIGGTAEDGKKLKAQFLAGLPALAPAVDRMQASWRATAKAWYNKKFHRKEMRDGYIRGLDGRPIQVDSEHKVLVYQLQSDEAIQMSVAYCKMHQLFQKEGWHHGRDYGVVLFMHDEFQYETRPELADRAAEIGCEAIAWAGRYLNIPVPHEGEAKIGRNWSQTH